MRRSTTSRSFTSFLQAVAIFPRLNLLFPPQQREARTRPLEAEATGLLGDGRIVASVSQITRVIGLFAIADAIRPICMAAVETLRERKIEVVMPSGDNAATAKRIADDLSINSVLADVLPVQNAQKIKQLRATGRKVDPGRHRRRSGKRPRSADEARTV